MNRRLFAIFLLSAALASGAHAQGETAGEVVEQARTEKGGHVLVFGASGGTGLAVARELRERGYQITAFVRPTSDRTELQPLGVRFVEGDAVVEADVRKAFDGADYDAVYTTLGCFRCEVPPDYVGNKHVFDAALDAGVKRVIMVSSIGAGDSKDAPPWISRWMLKDVVKLKTQAEDHLMSLPLQYTIVRPGGLKTDEPTGDGYLTEDNEAMGIITRADLGVLLADIIDDPDSYRKVYAAVDRNLSWPWDMF